MKSLSHPANDWFRDSRMGVMCHYMDKAASSNAPSATTAEEWNCRVDSFDVARFASDIKSTSADYVIFTLGQNTGHFCAPNREYDRIIQIHPSKLSKRDLILEIAEALAPEVRLIAYLPSHAPSNDAEAVKRFHLCPPWSGRAWGLPDLPPGTPMADARLSEFQRHWEAVVRYWGEAWGEKVAGWWIDGCYFAGEMYSHPDEPNFASFARALRAGNGHRLLAFNSGTRKPFEVLTEEQDYSAGEVSTQFPVPNKWDPLGKGGEGQHLHLLSYLGSWWGEGDPRFNDAFVAGYTQMVNASGGVMTWDVPIAPDGKIPPAFLRQLRKRDETRS